jgi:hypothetical protein
LFELALPNNPAADAGEYWPALTTIGGIGVSAGGLLPIWIACLVAQSHEVEHVDRTFPVVPTKFSEGLFCWIDVSDHPVSCRNSNYLLRSHHQELHSALKLAALMMGHHLSPPMCATSGDTIDQTIALMKSASSHVSQKVWVTPMTFAI